MARDARRKARGSESFGDKSALAARAIFFASLRSAELVGCLLGVPLPLFFVLIVRRPIGFTYRRESYQRC